MALALAKRVLHDLFHVALVPFSILIVLGMVSEEVHEVIERIDLAIHLFILVLAADSLRDWLRRRKRQPVAEHACQVVAR